ncbi:succinylglutamic semialdehyde dehydrogenase [uncultured Sphingopyxis sp.]|uniref:Succinylglutamic semialdehyde dehydrogenase n=1 Tax=uncultured Sphingopyxis sp. TaxID=310581 RepID=A0A1Y5PY00_9SPHN|nr:succinylglutamate-semialdehyde dehydrogenase [uncultured Sphingopyxis sp.]SBV32377.1 succinylglutamic semialdehyde dehydrogenase [uncultured Sphingopyxis sp.]
MSAAFISTDPANGDTVWEGAAASADDCARAVAAARAAFPAWAGQGADARIAVLQRYAAVLGERQAAFAEAIARETGKPLWEAQTEIASMIGKVAISVKAMAERSGTSEGETAFGRARLSHRPHGVMAVLGPYNFPGHLPNGHIVPALLAGNTIVFKPSEETPLVGQLLVEALHAAGVPDDVAVLVQGGRDTGAALVAEDIDGLLFTGSAGAGAHFRRLFADRPAVILALELGGNNPLVAWDGDADAAASIIVASAFITTGQRCSCARRLIVPGDAAGDAIVDAVAALTGRLRIGAWNEAPEPFMGPLISGVAAGRAVSQVETLVGLGARVIRAFEPVVGRSAAFVTPAILDVTGLEVPDEEIFAPVLQVRRVPDIDAALVAANATRFGLSAALISNDDALWARFRVEARAGVVNRNRPTTGASSDMPFGGIGHSGNHRPSAYYAADYCAWPVASLEADNVVDQLASLKGVAS